MENLRQTLSRSKDAMDEAIGRHLAQPTPVNTERVRAAMREYHDLRTSLIGAEAASKFQAAFDAVAAAADRLSHAKQEQDVALKALEAAQKEIDALLEAAIQKKEGGA